MHTSCMQVVREASRRVLGLRPFDVQLIGGMILHAGQIAEMRTGEGKTLVAVLPAYLNALSGKGVQARPPLGGRACMHVHYICLGQPSCCSSNLCYEHCRTQLHALPKAALLQGFMALDV